jgi:hypothetical protein
MFAFLVVSVFVDTDPWNHALLVFLAWVGRVKTANAECGQVCAES